MLKSIRYSRSTDGSRPGAVKALMKPQTQSATATRAFALLAYMSLLVALTFALLALNLMSRNLYQITYNFGSLVISVAIFITYVNYSLVPITVRVKLVGVTLAILMVTLGFAGTFVLTSADRSYHREHAELARKITAGGVEAIRLTDAAYLAIVGGPIFGASDNGERRYDLVYTGPVHLESEDFIESDEAYENMLKARGQKPQPREPGDLSFRLFDLDDPSSFYTTYLVDADGGRYEVGFPYIEYRARIHRIGLIFFLFAVISTILVLVLVPTFFKTSVLKPLTILLDGVERVDRGDLDVSVTTYRMDELGRLTDSFNTMVSSIRQSATERENLNAAYRRFVPSDLLELLGKVSIIDVNLGDQIMRDMAVMFSDIRSFTTLSEQMTPRENFRFLNGYLSRIAPTIRRHSGYIDKYLGDGILSVFPSSRLKAVEAAIDLMSAVVRYNEDRLKAGYMPIHIGCGLHAGEVMLGTIGEQDRMDGTVIADAVNVASRVEGLNKVFGTSILATESIMSAVTDESIRSRRLGKFQVKGKREPVTLFEVIFDEDGSSKESIRGDLREALECLGTNRIGEALRKLDELSSIYPHDGVVSFYAQYCRRFSQELNESGAPDVISIDYK